MNFTITSSENTNDGAEKKVLLNLKIHWTPPRRVEIVQKCKNLFHLRSMNEKKSVHKIDGEL
jgi:hypothetical protein